jgi:hypothetical protein
VAVYDRNKIDLWNRGRKAALERAGTSDCPDANEQPEDARVWMDGFKEGQAEKNRR